MSYKRAYSETDPDGANIDSPPFPQMARVTHTAEMDTMGVTERIRVPALDLYYSGATVAPKVFDAIAPDLLLQKSGEVRQFKQGGTINHYTRVFSSMNSLQEDPNLTHYELVQKLRFAGTAQGGVSYEEDRPNSNYIAVTTGGSHSIPNNGVEHIMSGDELWWDPPQKDPITGQATGYTLRKDDPPGKIPAAVVRPYKADLHGGTSLRAVREMSIRYPQMFTDATTVTSGSDPLYQLFHSLVKFAAMAQQIDLNTEVDKSKKADALLKRSDFRQSVLNLFLTPEKAGFNAAASTEAKQFASIYVEMMNAFAANMNYISGRKFGKALSNAAPGKSLDIVFGTYRTG